MLTAQEFNMVEPLPLEQVHRAIFEFCRGREDVTVFGAQAVNIYVQAPRMTQDVDLLTAHPGTVAAELAECLHGEFHVAIRVREVHSGVAYRVYQARGEGPRHFADLRANVLEEGDAIERAGVRYLALHLLVAMKVCALVGRRLAPKGATDLADLRRLLLAHPHMRQPAAGVFAAIERFGGGPKAELAWRELLDAPSVSDDDVDEGY